MDSDELRFIDTRSFFGHGDDVMESVHGDLLIGGVSIHDVDALLDDVEPGERCEQSNWHGHVAVDAEKRPQLETGRQYRLELMDGRAGQIVVDQMHEEEETHSLVLDFHGVSPLK